MGILLATPWGETPPLPRELDVSSGAPKFIFLPISRLLTATHIYDNERLNAALTGGEYLCENTTLTGWER